MGLDPHPSGPYLHSFDKPINSNLIKASILYKEKRWMACTDEWLRTEEMATDKPPEEEETIGCHSPKVA